MGLQFRLKGVLRCAYLLFVCGILSCSNDIPEEKCGDVYIKKQLVDPWKSAVLKDNKVILKRDGKSPLPAGILKCRVLLFGENEYIEAVLIKDIDEDLQYGDFMFEVKDLTRIYVSRGKDGEKTEGSYTMDENSDSVKKIFRDNFDKMAQKQCVCIDLGSEYFAYESLPEPGHTKGSIEHFSQVFDWKGVRVVSENKYVRLTPFSYAGMREQGFLSLGDTIISACGGDGSGYHKEILKDWKILDDYMGIDYVDTARKKRVKAR